MFTGIVEDIGTIKKIDEGIKEKIYTISVNRIDIAELVLGESIAVNGICLTVVSTDTSSFTVEASHETLSKTNLSKVMISTQVNLERALKASERFGGHIVTGHIDGTGKVISIKNVGKSIEYRFSVPTEMTKYIIKKGSVAVDGISLTVNEVDKDKFSVNIIPYTQKETTISSRSVNDEVNIECDIIGKYVEKLMFFSADNDNKFSELLKKL